VKQPACPLAPALIHRVPTAVIASRAGRIAAAAPRPDGQEPEIGALTGVPGPEGHRAQGGQVGTGSAIG